jgi:selenocysteine lyase/cysteine desulfurase
MGALWGNHEAIAELEGPNHFFIPKDEVPYKFELGGASHEGCAGLLALQSYLAMLAGVSHDGGAGDLLDRASIERAFDVMTQLELPLQQRIIQALKARRDIRLIGPSSTGPDRVPTISFVHDRLASSEVARRLHEHNIACRNGHMYAYRLCEALGLDLADGVVRLSLVHYNAMDEVDRLLDALDAVLTP